MPNTMAKSPDQAAHPNRAFPANPRLDRLLLEPAGEIALSGGIRLLHCDELTGISSCSPPRPFL
jgi:hypothetical protein